MAGIEDAVIGLSFAVSDGTNSKLSDSIGTQTVDAGRKLVPEEMLLSAGVYKTNPHVDLLSLQEYLRLEG